MSGYEIDKILIGRGEISAIVQKLGAKISYDYRGSNSLVLVCILKGSVMFFADLAREISLDAELDFMQVSSYGSATVSSGEIKIVKDLQGAIAGKDVLIVEDIIDSGRTAKCLCDMLMTRNPRSLEFCTLLDKPERRETDIEPRYVGKVIPDEFVVGYGLDYGEKYRNLKDVCTLTIKDQRK